jgi:glyoxylase-like metal-dependent hydrolase (beta-lactamase superfamily II)
MSRGFVAVTPHIYKLDLSFFAGFTRVGVWLVRADDGWTMVDTGAPDHAPKIVRATLALTADIPPRRIILTHGHPDHAGGLRALWERWGIPVLAHPAEAPFVLGTQIYEGVRPAWWGYRLAHHVVGSHGVVAPVDRVEPIVECDVVAGLEVRHVPGHTPGMIALIHREDRAIIAGDTFVSRNGRLRHSLDLFTPDREAARRAMARLAEEDFDHLLPSHGRPILGAGKAEAERAARHG